MMPSHSSNIKSHAFFMRAALREAEKAIGNTTPNPTVGAIIVRDKKIIARGHHIAAGLPHAEIEALRALSSFKDAKGATLYVTLEPCSTQGKTGACTNAIIQAGFTHVVYGATDPNPSHQGRAKKILEAAGIQVTDNILEKECTNLNKHWNYRMKTGLPWVIAKCGMSLDGMIASPPERRWITSEESRHDAMRLRARVEAILIGAATLRIDNPKLTLRDIHIDSPEKISSQPWRIVWSPSGDIPQDAQILCDHHREKTVIMKHASFRNLLKELGEKNISSLLIEGGGQTLGTAFRENLVNEIQFYIAPIIIGGPTPATSSTEALPKHITLEHISYKQLGNDIVLSALVASASRQ